MFVRKAGSQQPTLSDIKNRNKEKLTHMHETRRQPLTYVLVFNTSVYKYL